MDLFGYGLLLKSDEVDEKFLIPKPHPPFMFEATEKLMSGSKGDKTLYLCLG